MADNDLTTTAKALINVNQRLQKVEKGGSTGGSDTGGGNTPVDPTVPDSGVNVDPGTSLTGQKQVWNGTTKQNAEDKLILDSSVSNNLDNVGDGLQFVFKIVKMPITNGIQGSSSDLTPIATTSTTPVSGKYVCSVPVPISIKKGSFAVGTTLTVKLDGIGEGLSGVTVSMAPEVQFMLNNDGTISVKPIEGYAFDKLTAGNTGAYYDLVITSVSTYSVSTPVPPLANGTMLWSGKATATPIDVMVNPPADVPETAITLDGKLRSDFSNVGGGIEVQLDPNMQDSQNSNMVGYSTSKVFSLPLRLSKSDLVVGNTVTFASHLKGTTPSWNANAGIVVSAPPIVQDAFVKVKVLSGSLNISLRPLFGKSSETNIEAIEVLTKIVTFN